MLCGESIDEDFYMPEGTSYLQPKEARIGIHETWCDATIAAVPVDQNEFPLSHLPGLLHEFRKDAAPHYFRRMISMKIDLHTAPLVHGPAVLAYFPNFSADRMPVSAVACSG